MPLYTPDREQLPPDSDDFEDESPQYKRCHTCEKVIEEFYMVKDYINENDLCNRVECIEESMNNDFEHMEGSELIKANEYYNNLLNQIK